MGLFNEKEEVKLQVENDNNETVSSEAPVEIAVISSSTKIEGNIKTDGHLIMNGDVQGNVSTKGNLVLSGTTTGEIYCDSVLVETEESNSDIIAEQNIIIAQGTTVNGNVSCKNITVLGRVYGDIKAFGSVVLKSTAVVDGNITAKSIGMETGAVVNGTLEMN